VRVVKTDPPVSEAQRRAMWAAKSGHSTLGIPKSVGKEFAEADPGGKLPEHKDDDCSGYLDACRRGDSVGMTKHRVGMLGKQLR